MAGLPLGLCRVQKKAQLENLKANTPVKWKVITKTISAVRDEKKTFDLPVEST